jgi:hypothetical protein
MLVYSQQRYLKNWNIKRRKQKTFKMGKCECIPTFMKTVRPDPFDYQLRCKEEVMRDLSVRSLIPIKIIKTTVNESYMPNTLYRSKEFRMNETAKIEFKISDLWLSGAQKERLIYLLDTKYKGIDRVTIQCNRLETYDENLIKLQEIFKELVYESLRAPSTDPKALRDPYYFQR